MFKLTLGGFKSEPINTYRHECCFNNSMGAESTYSHLELDSAAKRTTGLLAALASYNATCRQALRFFIKPKLEVTILEPIFSPEFNPFTNKGLVAGRQALLVTAKKTSVNRLRAKVWMDGHGPMYFSWSNPSTTLDVDTGNVSAYLKASSQTGNYMDFVRDESIPLPIWLTIHHPQEEADILILNTEARVVEPLNNLKEPMKISIEIQFIGENYAEKNRHKFRLDASSWNKVGLTKLS